MKLRLLRVESNMGKHPTQEYAVHAYFECEGLVYRVLSELWRAASLTYRRELDGERAEIVMAHAEKQPFSAAVRRAEQGTIGW